MIHVAPFAMRVHFEKAPWFDLRGVGEQCPGFVCLRWQDDAVEILATNQVEASGLQTVGDDLVAVQAQFPVAAGENDPQRMFPGMIVQAAIRIAGEKSVDVDTATAGQAKQVVAFQVGLAVVAVDDAATQSSTQTIQ